MSKMMRRTVAMAMIFAVAIGMLTGCAFMSKKFAPEPFAVEWGITQEEAQEQLKCVYLTNDRSEDAIYVMGADNEGMEAFGTAPKAIIYNFDLVQEGSDEPRLGEIIISFPSEEYDNVLAYLEGKLGKSAFENMQWGAKDTDVYLFKDGIIQIEYSSDPIEDPDKIAEDSRDRYVALSGMMYGNKNKMAQLSLDSFYLLWGYSTAETDFVKTDNTK